MNFFQVVSLLKWAREFGLPEESFDHRKRGHLRAGLGRLLETGSLPNGVALPRLPCAVDLAVVEPGADGKPTVRLYRNALDG